ncbi:MAG: hypothetical protein AVDCRST_MAG64-4119 [uncultured Phycisphaerae bacterium]|uniref:histidine kinase n=1 Tax=uncultured Phycisphaerae bacterium TaxID=904963 RepID=A0A6J4QD88_9BACT|nr:MAG: hypothetical protein AVDCRST_MAG64-4119 [uncultured Phycisphaerae bacterium]
MSSPAPAPKRRSDLSSALRITLIYALFAAVWILLSDRLLELAVGPDRVDRLRWLQTAAGLLFVVITAGLLFGVVTRRLRQIRAAQTESADTAARLATFTDNLPGVAFIKDAGGRFVFARGRSTDAAVPMQDVLNGAFLARLTPDERAMIARNDQAVFEGGSGSQLVETLALPAGLRHFLVHRFPLRGPAGEPLVGGIALDVTERTEAEARIRQLARQLEDASRMKDQFLSNLSHELRTPITAIRLWTEVLRDPDPGDMETIREAVGMIRHSAVTQSLLIEDLLDVTRIIGGRLTVDQRPMSLADVVRHTVELLEPMAQEREATVRTALPTTAAGGVERCPMLGDARRVQQVVWNLLTNAIKFSGPRGEVDCRLARDADEWVLTVSDHGVGIRPDQLAHVFDRFRQTESTRVRPEGGVGIGLSIVKHLVEAHGGTVSAHSEGENRGAKFAVRFPAANEAAARPADDTPLAGLEPAAAPATQPLFGRRVLLVEDSADSRTGMTLLLGKAGAKVTAVDSAEPALSAGDGFDMLLSDIGLPDQDGCELVTQIRRRPEWRGRPAIAISAYALPEDKARALAAGFDDFVVKPVDPDKLIELMAEWFAKPRPVAAA